MVINLLNIDARLFILLIAVQKMGDRGSMKEVFVQCQTGLQGHGKLMKTLQKIYDKVIK